MTDRESAAAPSPAFGHQLVPLDGSRLAEAVLPAVVEIARRCHGRVTLLHVIERGAPATVHGERHLDDPDEARAYLAEVAGRLAAEGVAVDTHVHPNLEHDVAGSIVGHAVEFGNDLVVLATHGSGGLRDVIVGSIAEQALGRGSTPVLLLRPESPTVSPTFAVHRALVPLDGTPDSERALPLAEALAGAWQAPLVLLRVVPTRGSLPAEQSAVATMLPGATAAALQMEREATAAYLAGLVAGLRARGAEASAEVLQGEPSAVVQEAVRRLGADLVVMATHGRSGLGAFWSRSIGHRLAERLDVPLLILRSDRTA